MPKRARELTARAVASLKNDGRYAVGVVVGLYLKIDGGSRSWVLRVKRDGRRRDLGLGSFPEISLAEARDRAWKRRRALPEATPAGRGVADLGAPQEIIVAAAAARALAPPAAAGATKPVRTFKFCAETYIAAQSPGWKSAKHAQQWTSTLTTYAFSVIGTIDVSEIALEHILLILQPIWTTKTETASRVRGRIESILDWSTHRGYRSGKNPASWGGNLEHELPSPAKLKRRTRRHHPALPYLRIGAFMVDLRSRQGVSIRALEWGILTASRSQEIRLARRCEISIPLKRWTIPAERMKLEKEHVVPLSPAAISLYESLPVVKDCDLLFPSPEGGPLSDAALSELVVGMHEADVANGGIGYLDTKQNRVATPHGFRSTFRDWAAEVACVPWEIAEHALAHKLKDAAEAAYQRGELLMKRARLMKQWEQFCSNVCTEASTT